MHPAYTPATMNHFQSWTHQALTGVLHPACAHAALCSIGLATSDYLSKLSGVTCPLEKAFLARLYKYSSCPLPWPRWFRCSFLSVPVAQAAYCYHSTNFVYWFVMLTRLSLSWGQGYLSSYSKCLKKYSVFTRCSMNVFGKNQMS